MQRMGNDLWRPKKRLTLDQMDHLRHLKREKPDDWSNESLAKAFGISVPAVVRILKSKFEGTPEIRAKQDAKAKEQAKLRKANHSTKPISTPSPVSHRYRDNYLDTNAEDKEQAKKRKGAPVSHRDTDADDFELYSGETAITLDDLEDYNREA